MDDKEVNVNEVREHLAEYLSKAERGEEIIIKRYSKKVARIVAYEEKQKGQLPDLTEFRKEVGVLPGKSLADTVREMRDNER